MKVTGSTLRVVALLATALCYCGCSLLLDADSGDVRREHAQEPSAAKASTRTPGGQVRVMSQSEASGGQSAITDGSVGGDEGSSPEASEGTSGAAGASGPPASASGASDVCVDFDGDGAFVGCDTVTLGIPTDCDDEDAENAPGRLELCDGRDNDCDGVADADASGEVDADGDGYLSCEDCDDGQLDTFPGAVEFCDGRDNDCNGVADADISGEVDTDGDGYLSCEDCDDSQPDTFPGAVELCDGRDNDCNGAADADAGGEVDADRDGYLSCEECDDAHADTYPGALELCDGRDNDCSGAAEFPGELVDADADGSLSCVDCNDSDPNNFPYNVEVCDSQDNDCDGAADYPGELTDADMDGFVACADCDDSDPASRPGAPELCDGRDNDCNGLADADAESESDSDGDGFLSCAECDDSDPNTHPGAEELCDGKDNDCNGVAEYPGELVDADEDGSPACADCDENDPNNFPGNAEACDGKDNDCSGAADLPGELIDTDADGFPSCADCNDQDPAISPNASDPCDGVDNDCSGVADDGEAWVTFIVHGPPSDATELTQSVTLSLATMLDGVSLDLVAPLTWAAEIELPLLAPIDYVYTREGTAATAEVGPMGEASPLHSVTFSCDDRVVEDAVWHWDDLTDIDQPVTLDKGPIVTAVGEGADRVTITVDLTASQPIALRWRAAAEPYAASNVITGTGQAHYELEVTGLMPGTAYAYVVEVGSWTTSEQTFRTSSSSGTPFRFVAFGDSQDQAGHEAHADIVRSAYAFAPDLVVRVGDQVDVGSDSAQWDRFFAIERFLIGNAIYLPALGNHEGQSQYYFDYFALPTYPDAVPPVPPEQYYRVKYNNTLFIVLSTETTVGGDQRKWLEETLKSAQADPEIYWMVATFHRPPFSTGMHGSEMSVREAWHGLLRDYGVSLVLNGHEHSYEHVFVEGVHYLVMGGGGATLRAFSSDPASWTMYRESVYHLAVFDVDGHELRATVLRRDGSEMDSFILGVRQDGCEEAAECWGLGHSECSGTWLCQNAQCTWTCD